MSPQNNAHLYGHEAEIASAWWDTGGPQVQSDNNVSKNEMILVQGIRGRTPGVGQIQQQNKNGLFTLEGETTNSHTT